MYKTVKVISRTHVVCHRSRQYTEYDEPNYMNTGMALCGVLLPGETLEQFIDRKKEINKRLFK